MDLSLNWVIRLASPKPVRQPSIQASSACSGTWLCTNTVHAGIKARSEQLRGRDPGPAAQQRRVLRHRDRMQVNDAIERVVGVLQRHPLADRAKVVSEMKGVSRRLDAGQYARPGHGRKSSLPRPDPHAALRRTATGVPGLPDDRGPPLSLRSGRQTVSTIGQHWHDLRCAEPDRVRVGIGVGLLRLALGRHLGRGSSPVPWLPAWPATSSARPSARPPPPRPKSPGPRSRSRYGSACQHVVQVPGPFMSNRVDDLDPQVVLGACQRLASAGSAAISWSTLADQRAVPAQQVLDPRDVQARGLG